jgi:polyhydroxybutyrate depolymerase
MTLLDLYFSGWRHPGTNHSIQVGGLNRSYVVHAPKRNDPNVPMPVVLVLHGATMNGPMMAWFCGLNEKADEVGFIVIYPNGTGKRSSLFWNGGNCCGSAMQNNVDDVAFIDTLLDDVTEHYPVDAQRIYATGMSNGAIMAYRLAAELSVRIAAIAPVAGSRGVEIGLPKRPVSILHFHGTDDEFVPFAGGRGKKSITGTHFYSVEESIQPWLKFNGCNVSPMVEVLTKEGDDMTVTRKTYLAGESGAEVAVVSIEGGGHTWPGRKSPAKLLGKSTVNISANDLIWEFFQRHPLG